MWTSYSLCPFSVKERKAFFNFSTLFGTKQFRRTMVSNWIQKQEKGDILLLLHVTFVTPPQLVAKPYDTWKKLQFIVCLIIGTRMTMVANLITIIYARQFSQAEGWVEMNKRWAWTVIQQMIQFFTRKL